MSFEINVFVYHRLGQRAFGEAVSDLDLASGS